MAKPPKLVAVALALVLCAAAYGRGAIAKDYSAFNACVIDYIKAIRGHHGDFMSPDVYCREYLPVSLPRSSRGR